MSSPSTRKRGSKQFWPRVRAKKMTAVINSWASKNVNEINFLGFPSFKVGMSNIGVIDNFSHTLTKGTKINLPVTVLECPPIKVLSLKLFAFDEYENLQVVKEVRSNIKDKFLAKKISLSKKTLKIETIEKLIEFAKENVVEDVRVMVISQPSLTTIGKKVSDILELGISGSIEEKIKFAYDKLGKEVKVSEVLKAGQLVDSHAITIGRGFQGAVKRFGVKLTSHKSEKKRRHAGNVGAWTPSRVLHTIPLAGQHGFHERTEWNKWILKISSKPDEINPKQGFHKYGYVKSDYILIKGSVQGSKRRLVSLVKSIRGNKRYPKIAPEVVYINK